MAGKAQQTSTVNLSNEELVNRLSELEAKLEALTKETMQKDKEIAVREQQISDILSEGDGWLVITPNPLYDGVLYGVKFSYGMAFIPIKREFPDLAVPQPKVGDRNQYTDKQWAELQKSVERAARPTSERVIEFLRDDFKYKVEWFDGKNAPALRERITQRKNESLSEARRLDSRNETENMMMPYNLR